MIYVLVNYRPQTPTLILRNHSGDLSGHWLAMELREESIRPVSVWHNDERAVAYRVSLDVS